MTDLVRIERHDAITVLHLEAGRANAMSDALLGALGEVWTTVAAPPTRAIVVTGQGPHFSGGLALPDLIERDRDAMRTFIERFATVMDQVWSCGVPTVAALNGHAIAGGCVLALVCDVRIAAAGPARIGLNEGQLGIGLPAIVTGPLRQKLTPAAWVPIALEGRLFDVEAAARLGLVDEIVAADALLPRALARAGELATVPTAAFAQIKRALRGHRDAPAERQQTELWLDTWFDDEAQTRLRAAVAKLRR